eukprot:scaffold349_cov244-Pinguiococcus_pyrenoidosus.AAC.4
MGSSADVLAGNFRGLQSADSSSPVMWAVAIGFLGFMLFYAYRAQQMDTEDALHDASFRGSVESLQEWMAYHDVSPNIRRKLYDNGVRTMRDIDVMATMTSDEIHVVCRRFGLDPIEIDALEHAILGSTAGAVALAQADDDDDDREEEEEDHPSGSPGDSSRRGMAGSSGEASATRSAWQKSPWRSSLRKKADPFALPRVPIQPSKSRRIVADEDEDEDRDLWYGLRLAKGLDELIKFEEKGLAYRMAKAAKEGHEYYDALSLHPGDTPTRFVRVVRLSALVASTLVTTALVYQTLYPDDTDYCGQFDSDPVACEEDESSLNRNENRCFFDSDEGCAPTTPELTAETLIFAAALAIIFVIPLQLCVDFVVYRYLGDSPYLRDADAPINMAFTTKRELLRREERKRARSLAAEELDTLVQNPALVPPFYRIFVQRLFGDDALRWCLGSRVRAAAMEAARLETVLEPDHRVLNIRLEAGHITKIEYIEAVRNRKIQVIKIAIRDSLPYIKKRVFRKYTHLLGHKQVVPLYKRRIALGVLYLYVLTCCAYLIGFGVTTSSELALGWVFSLLIGEIATVLLLLPLRIAIIGVVLPALVRQDVTIERAITRMPHYSAAAILARSRRDLLPGLDAILDEQFQEKEAQEEEAPAKSGGGGEETKDPSTQNKIERRPSLKVALRFKDVMKAPLDEVEGATAAASEGSSDKAEAEEASPKTEKRVRFMLDDRSSKSSDVEDVSLGTELDQEMAASARARYADELRKRSGGQTGAAREMRLSSAGEPKDADVSKEAELEKIAAEKAAAEKPVAGHLPEDPDDLNEGKLEDDTSSDNSGFTKPHVLSERTTIDREAAYTVGRELRRRPWPLKIMTRCLLGLLALVVLLPEPMQDLFLDEGKTRRSRSPPPRIVAVSDAAFSFCCAGLPIGFAFFVVADIGLDLSNDYWNVVVQCILLIIAFFIVMSVVFVVHRSIEASLHKIRSREVVSTDEVVKTEETNVDRLQHVSPEGRASATSS